MNGTLSARGLYYLGGAALGARLFFAATLDAPGLQNAAYISCLIACAYCLPLAFCLRFIARRSAGEAAAGLRSAVPGALFYSIALAGALLSVWEAAAVLRLLTQSAQFVALDGLWEPAILLAVAFTGFVACLTGVGAIGGAVKLSLFILILALLIAVPAQLPHMNARFLTPLFGPGPRALFLGAVPLSGHLSMLPALFLLGDGGPESKSRRFGMPAILLSGCLAACGAALLFYLQSPAVNGAPDTREYLLNRMLANGRNSLSLQILLVPALYASLLCAFCAFLACAARALSLLIPPLKPPLCALFPALGALALAYFRLPVRENLPPVAATGFFAMTALFFLAALAARRAKAPAKK